MRFNKMYQIKDIDACYVFKKNKCVYTGETRINYYKETPLRSDYSF